jgi:hypothetical protein
MKRFLMNSLSKKTIESVLNELLKDLNYTYDEAMKPIDDDHKELAYHVSSLLMHAREPLFFNWPAAQCEKG